MRRLASAFLIPALLLGCARRSPEPPRNLLLVTIDTLRADRVGAYGSRAGLTPAIDALAASGWLFENAVSPVPLTLPAHATLLSGLDPRHHGVRNNGTYVFPETQATLATRLKDGGYATGAFVAAVVLDRRYGLARGFDVYDDRIARQEGGRSELESERPCETVTDAATAWIRSQKGPYFAWVHFYEPHAPYASASSGATAEGATSPYDADVRKADGCLATLLTAAAGATPGRVVTAVTSDHGEGLGEHGETTHGLFVYQSTLRVPLVIAGPGIPAGKRATGLTRSADLAPTLLGLLGVEGLGLVDGRDLTGGPGAGEAYAESDYATGFGWAPLRSWRLGDLKLIDAPKAELFDLAQDPNETNNLAAARPHDVERLRGVLRAALNSEVKGETRRADAATEERLRSLGYVAGASRSPSSRASGLDPKEAIPLLRRFEEAMDAQSRGDLVSSVRILQELIAKDRTSLTFHRSLASALRRSARGDEALRVLQSAEKLDPLSAEIAHDQSLTQAELGRLVQAIESETRALAIDPAFVDALDHLATLHAQMGRLDQALDSANKALAIDANHARAWANRGNIARAQGRRDEAEKSYIRALELSPRLADALNGRAVLAVEAGRLDAATGWLLKAIEADPQFDEARLNLAVVEAQRGDVPKAIELALITGRQAEDSQLRAKALQLVRDLRSLPH